MTTFLNIVSIAVFMTTLQQPMKACIPDGPPVKLRNEKKTDGLLLDWSGYNRLAKAVFRVKIRDVENLNEEAIATAFLCRFHFDGADLIGLMTNAHVIDQAHLLRGEMLKIESDSSSINVTIDLKNDVIRWYVGNHEDDDGLDATFLELENGALSSLQSKTDAEPLEISTTPVRQGQNIAILQHPNGGALKVGTGKLIETNESLYEHDASTESGSSGSPILDYETLKLIAIHKGSLDERPYNLAVNVTSVLDAALEQFAQVNLDTCSIPDVEYGIVVLKKGGDGVRPLTKKKIGTIISVRCNAGFFPTSINSQTCSSSGTWIPSSAHLSCNPCSAEKGQCNGEVVTCPQFPAIQNGILADGGVTYGSQRRIHCNSGYQIDIFSAPVITCLANGTWSTPISCMPITCDTLPPFSQGRIGPGSSIFQSSRLLSCNVGFKLIGSKNITCLADGSWSQPSTCSIVTCPSQLPVISNGFFYDGDVYYNTERYLSCNPGFQASGSPLINCQADGTWSTPGSCSPITCNISQLPLVSNGHLTGSHSNYYQASRNVTCNVGYVVSDVGSTITCQSNGQWSKPGNCDPIHCDSPRIENGYAKNGPSAYGSSGRAVECNSGYRVSSQDERITCQANGRWSSNVWCIMRTVKIDCCNLFNTYCCCEQENGDLLRQFSGLMSLNSDCAWRGFEKCKIGWKC